MAVATLKWTNAEEVTEKEIKDLEEKILKKASMSEEVIISKNGFNTRLGDITAHDISLKLIEVKDTPAIEVAFTHYLDSTGDMYTQYRINCKEVCYDGIGLLYLNPMDSFEHSISIHFLDKRTTEFCKYYRYFEEVNAEIQNIVNKAIAEKGFIIMNSLSGFYPEYFSEGELTMKSKVVFNDIEKFDLKMMVVQENENTQPVYLLRFATNANVGNSKIEREWMIDNITNISITGSNSIILYRLTGCPVYITFGR